MYLYLIINIIIIYVFVYEESSESEVIQVLMNRKEIFCCLVGSTDPSTKSSLSL